MVPDELIAGHVNSEDEYALTEFQIELLRCVRSLRAEAMEGPPSGYTLTDMDLNKLGRMADKR